jgi:hypothetical protein
LKFLKTKHERKSFIITTVIYAIILVLMFMFGFKYFDPPKEKGIAVNFGTTDFGSGEVQPNEPIKTAPKQVTPETTPVEEASSAIEEEDVINQTTEDAPVIKDDKKEQSKEVQKDKPEKQPKEVQPKKNPKEQEEPKKPEPKPEPKPDKSVTDAMESLMNGPENNGQEANGEGNDTSGGDKGNPNGDPNAKNYYGTGKGLDGDGNYRLGGRKALNKEKYIQDCNESGEVVVRIEVNRNGKVIRAIPGQKGTTNTSPCLLEPAKRAALNTKFNSDTNAPSKQFGFITYVFKLSE